MSNPNVVHRVLLVDDDTVVQMLASALLRRGGYVVETASDGVDALARLRKGETFDLVVTDLSMPNLDGAALLASLRRDPATAALPVIVLTGSDDASMHSALIGAGALACIAKPIDAGSFVDRLRAVTSAPGTR